MQYDKISCYVLDKRTGSRVEFEASVPEEVNESYMANYDDMATKGRSSPFKAYSHSGPHSVSFTVMLSLDYNKDLVQKVEKIRNMMKPHKGVVVEGPKMHVRIGNVVNMDCVPLDFSATWANGYKNSTYNTCDLSFSFDEIEGTCTFATNTVTGSAIATASVGASSIITKAGE